MANHLSYLLAQWYPQRDDCEWVLGTIYKTEGPCYRKAGAMVLFNSMGQQFGLLSGGCLETDIQRHARLVMQGGKPTTLCYDGSDEEDLSFLLGIGCGGTLYILLQPVNEANHFLGLDIVYLALSERKSGDFYQHISEAVKPKLNHFIAHELSSDIAVSQKAKLIKKLDQQWLVTPIHPEPHLLVVGGGIDARPLVTLAHHLGWYITLWDSRPANARQDFFLAANKILRCSPEDLAIYAGDQRVNAAVVMTHNISLDAATLRALQSVELRYLALLGPENRRDQVLLQARLLAPQLKTPIAGPAGLDIGAELPESIALSILAECHASLMNCSARSFCQLLKR